MSERMLKNCLRCGKEFSANNYSTKIGQGRFCSHKCASKYHYDNGNSKFLYFAKQAHMAPVEIEKNCVFCGKIFRARGYGRANQRYCSKECIHKLQAQSIPNKDEVVTLYKNGHSINWIWRKFHLPEYGVEQLLIDASIPIRSGEEQRSLLKKAGIGKWRKKLMAPCKVCGKPFYSKLNKRYCSVECEYKDPARINQMRDYTLKQIEEGRLYRSNTRIENVIKEFLASHKIQFKHQYRLGYWSFDFFIPDNKLIEVDGDYWHANPMFFQKLNTTQVKNIRNDEHKANYAQKIGYSLIRIWENDINHNWTQVQKQLMEVINNG